MNICVLDGGRSGEHEVSLKSAASVVKNLEPSKYRVTTIGIDKAGRRHLCCVWQAGHRLRVPVLHGDFGEDGTTGPLGWGLWRKPSAVRSGRLQFSSSGSTTAPPSVRNRSCQD